MTTLKLFRRGILCRGTLFGWHRIIEALFFSIIIIIIDAFAHSPSRLFLSYLFLFHFLFYRCIARTRWNRVQNACLSLGLQQRSSIANVSYRTKPKRFPTQPGQHPTTLRAFAKDPASLNKPCSFAVRASTLDDDALAKLYGSDDEWNDADDGAHPYFP